VVLQRLVLALGHADEHDPGGLAEVEQRGAHQVADVLHEHERPIHGTEGLQPAGEHVGVEMAAGPGVDLHDLRPGGTDPLRV